MNLIKGNPPGTPVLFVKPNNHSRSTWTETPVNLFILLLVNATVKSSAGTIIHRDNISLIILN
nr:hypothetical protein [Proteiniphilum sp. UBA5480]